MEEQRKFPRTPTAALVELVHPALGRIDVKARDLSDGGIFVLMGQHVCPPIGTMLQVRIKRFTGTINQDPVAMRVVHHQFGGVGLAFV